MDFFIYLSSDIIEYRRIDVAHQIKPALYHFTKSRLIDIYSSVVKLCLNAPFFPRYMFIHATHKQMIAMLHFIIAYDFQISPNYNFRLDLINNGPDNCQRIECIEID